MNSSRAAAVNTSGADDNTFGAAAIVGAAQADPAWG
jgi:hypothetical protein